MFDLSRGKDDRVLKNEQTRQSVSCDVNYGIRFTESAQVEKLFMSISTEVARKLDGSKLRGKQVRSRAASLSIADIFKMIDFQCRVEGLRHTDGSTG